MPQAAKIFLLHCSFSFCRKDNYLKLLKEYWSSRILNILILQITRANLNGSQQEPMSILAIVKELIIDSLEAYLYWSTGHAVEVARLNGQDRRYYHSDEIFNGKQVMGLTLDTENRYVYWIVRSYESGSILYRAPTSERIPMNQKIEPKKVILIFINIIFYNKLSHAI